MRGEIYQVRRDKSPACRILPDGELDIVRDYNPDSNELCNTIFMPNERLTISQIYAVLSVCDTSLEERRDDAQTKEQRVQLNVACSHACPRCREANSRHLVEKDNG